MKWFKHMSDARNSPKIRRVEKQLGDTGYARAFKLFEIIAERGGSGDKFVPRLNLNRSATDIEWLAEEWRTSEKEAEDTLQLFSSVGLIDARTWRRRIISVPQMTEYKDEWAQRQKRQNSVATPELLPSNSGATPAQSRAEVEADLESKKKSKSNGDA